MIINHSSLCLLLFARLGLPGLLHAQDNPHRNVIQQLTSIFENSTIELQYAYVENIKDGRGFTFGFAGFCSGTYDGTMFLKEYRRLKPDNTLVKFIPTFEQIDAGPHDAQGKNSDTKGLEAFPKAFAACARDPAFRRAQQNVVDKMYWRPSQVMAGEIGAKYAITQGELYDACINHGEDQVTALIRKVNQTLNGSPQTGVDEKKWLAEFLKVRLAMMKADPSWIDAIDRIAVYQKLLADGNVDLALPTKITCYGDSYTLK
jgi:chitosanase